MIKIYALNGYDSFTLDVAGHAEYAPKGKDIVCAAVSALVTTICNYAVESGHTSEHAVYEGDGIYLECKADAYAREVFRAAAQGLEEIARNYPRNVEITYLDSN